MKKKKHKIIIESPFTVHINVLQFHFIIKCIKMTITIHFILRKCSKFQFRMNSENRKYRKLKRIQRTTIRLTIHTYMKLAFRTSGIRRLIHMTNCSKMRQMMTYFDDTHLRITMNSNNK